MSNWDDISGDAWSFTKNRIVGIGGGIGQNHIAYAINLEHGIILNGKIEADVKLYKNGLTAAGIVCRADEYWSFLALYILYNPSVGSTFMGLGVCDKGSFRPVAALAEKILIDDNYNRFSLEFFSGRIIGKIASSEREYKVEQVVPHIAFPGYVGLIKLYGAEVVVKNFQMQKENPSLKAGQIIYVQI